MNLENIKRIRKSIFLLDFLTEESNINASNLLEPIITDLITLKKDLRYDSEESETKS